MDLLTLAGTLWRHKLAVIPVIVVTVLAMFYIVVVEPPTYKATASVLLVNPPSAPTSQQIAADPALGRLNTNNPYNSLNNLDYVADVLIEVVTAPAAKQQIVASGAQPRLLRCPGRLPRFPARDRRDRIGEQRSGGGPECTDRGRCGIQGSSPAPGSTERQPQVYDQRDRVRRADFSHLVFVLKAPDADRGRRCRRSLAIRRRFFG